MKRLLTVAGAISIAASIVHAQDDNIHVTVQRWDGSAWQTEASGDTFNSTYIEDIDYDVDIPTVILKNNCDELWRMFSSDRDNSGPRPAA